MRKIEVNEKELLTFERIAHMMSKESRLFRDGNVLYKVLRPEYRNGREKIINHLEQNPIPNLPIIYDTLIDPYSKEFLGYTMEFLTDYKTLEESANSDEYNFNERKKACYDMCQTIYKLIVRGYEHYDIHDRNVMIKGDKASIIDIDSMGNSLLGVTGQTKEPTIAMLNDITFVSLSYLVNQSKYHEQYDYYRHYDALLREFKDDKIMLAFISQQLKKLLTHGYTPESIIDSVGEGQVMRLNSIMEKN